MGGRCKRPVQEVFLDLILFNSKINNECIEWTGQLQAYGYGVLYYKNKMYLIHRYLYCIIHKLSYNNTSEVHHICKNKKCINSKHLELKTKVEHAKLHGYKKICWRGHDTSITGRSKQGVCLICRKLWHDIYNKERQNV